MVHIGNDWDALLADYFASEQYQTLRRFLAEEYLDVAKLFVCDTHDAYFSKLRQDGFHPFPMYFSVFHTGTMANVNRKLKHGKAVSDQAFPEYGIFANVFLCFGRKVE